MVALERHFSARRGAEHVLSPPDFALAREWHGAGVPLAAALAAIDQAFEAGPAPASLQPCRRLLEAPAPRAPGREPPPGPEPTAGLEPSDLRGRLARLEGALVLAQPAAAFEKAARRLRELIDLTAVAREPNWAYLEHKLEELDALVELAALEALPPAEAAVFQAEAARAADRQQGRVSADALAAARGLYLRRRARERFGLPRVAGG